MARRIRWQIVIAVISALLVVGLLSQLALSTTAVSQPQVGGSYTEAVAGRPTQLLPLINDPLTDPVGRDIGALLFDGLTRIGVDGLPAAALAEEWRIAENGAVYIFRLREDVVWHDGTPFTADDVVFTLRAIQDPAFPGDPALANLWRAVLIDRIDAYAVRFTLEAPYAPFLSAARVPILPAHLLADIPVADWATSDFARQPVGTGPYRLEELTSAGATLAANPDYFAGQPFVESFNLRFVDTLQATFSALTDGDMQALGATTALVPELTQIALPEAVQRISLPLDSYVVLSFNLREAPLNDREFRLALARGLDKGALVEQVYSGQVLRIDTPVLPGWRFFDPTLGWYPYDPVEATRTLDELGYARDDTGVRIRARRPLQLTLLTDSEPGRQAAAAELARQWEALGVAIEVSEVTPDDLRARLRSRDFTLALHGWARLGPDPDAFELWHSSQAATGLNYAGLEDAAIDEALVAGRLADAEDLAARNEAYAAFQRRWVELVPSITLYQPLYTLLVREEVAGLGFSPASIGERVVLLGREDRYRSVRNWFVRSSREIRGTLR